MTRILALDTATAACSVAIDIDGQCDEDFAVAPQDHTKRLLPMVDQLLARYRLSLHDIDAIAFTQGPGSFTGLRIGVGIVQGLAFGADLPVIPVSTLATLAASTDRLLGFVPNTLLAPALDARMGEVYWGLYQTSSAHEQPTCVLADQVSSPRDCVAALREYTGLQQNNEVPLHILGSACPLFKEEWFEEDKFASLNVQMHPDAYPHAQDAARIAEVLLRAGKTQSALQAHPVYIRNEVTWAKRQRIRS
jgi:tRNA threonylcarbamoyladenosine biosynthesis protein TsaB